MLTNKQEKEVAWKLIPDDFSGGAGSGKLKVVISYLPDNMAKPMSEPMKNNDGEFVFSYRVDTKMWPKIYLSIMQYFHKSVTNPESVWDFKQVIE